MKHRLTVALAVLVAAVSGCSYPDPGPDQTGQLLDELKAQRETIAGFVDDVDTKLAALESDASASGESASIAANLRSRLDEGRAVLNKLDAGIARVETELADVPDLGGGPAQGAADAAAAARGVAPLLPPPIGEIVGIVGILLGAGASAMARRKTKQAGLASEAVRDVLAGLDTFYESAVSSGDIKVARVARDAVRGRLSERTRPVVAAVAAHPVAVE